MINARSQDASLENDNQLKNPKLLEFFFTSDLFEHQVFGIIEYHTPKLPYVSLREPPSRMRKYT